MAYTLKNVFKGASIFTVGQILTKASGFFLIPIYTHFLTPRDYGIVGYVLVIAQFLSTILLFGFHGAQERFYYEYKGNREEVGQFLFSINMYLIAILLVFCTVVTVLGGRVYAFLVRDSDIPFFPYLMIAILSVFFSVLNQMNIRFNLAEKKYTKCAILQFIQFLLGTGSVIFFVVYLKQGAEGQLKGILLGGLIFFILFYWQYAKNFDLNFSFNKVKYALAFGVPVVLHLLVGVMHCSIDRVILERFVPLDDLGIYTLGYQIGFVMSVLVTAINQAWVVNYYDLMEDNAQDHAYQVKKAFYLWLACIGTICLIGSLWSNEFLIFLTPSSFHASTKIVPIVLFSYVFQGLYFFAVNPIFFYKKTKILPFTTGSSALLNIGLNFLLIPRYGIMGAAYATLLSYVYMAVIVYVIGKRYFDPKYNLVKISIVLSALFAGGLLFKLDRISIALELVKLCILFGFAGMSYLLFSDYLRPMLKNVRVIFCTSFEKQIAG